MTLHAVRMIAQGMIALLLIVFLAGLNGVDSCEAADYSEPNTLREFWSKMKVHEEGGVRGKRQARDDQSSCTGRDEVWDYNTETCNTCTKCPAGHESTARYCGFGCGERGMCRECALNHYREASDNNQTCHRCSTCDPDAVVMETCTRSYDTICGSCARGMGLIDGKYCVSCDSYPEADNCSADASSSSQNDGSLPVDPSVLEGRQCNETSSRTTAAGGSSWWIFLIVFILGIFIAFFIGFFTRPCIENTYFFSQMSNLMLCFEGICKWYCVGKQSSGQDQNESKDQEKVDGTNESTPLHNVNQGAIPKGPSVDLKHLKDCGRANSADDSELISIHANGPPSGQDPIRQRPGASTDTPASTSTGYRTGSQRSSFDSEDILNDPHSYFSQSSVETVKVNPLALRADVHVVPHTTAKDGREGTASLKSSLIDMGSMSAFSSLQSDADRMSNFRGDGERETIRRTIERAIVMGNGHHLQHMTPATIDKLHDLNIKVNPPKLDARALPAMFDIPQNYYEQFDERNILEETVSYLTMHCLHVFTVGDLLRKLCEIARFDFAIILANCILSGHLRDSCPICQIKRA